MRRAWWGPTVAGIAVALVVSAPGAAAAPSAKPGGLRLEIRPGGGAARSGATHTLTAEVSRDGRGVDGVIVAFELAGGPADDDIGTAGDTPATPDLRCVTSEGRPTRPATCAVAYADHDNEDGHDAVRAWIDDDGLDETVEADLGEGENQHAPGDGGCDANSKGPGATPEPDATDCVGRRWVARVLTAVELSPETGSAPLGTTATLRASVVDQFGDRLTGPLAATTVAGELLAGSANDPGDGADHSEPDLGTCDTGAAGTCVLTMTGAAAGTDTVCAYVAGRGGQCDEPPDAPESRDLADVVIREWTTLTPPTPGEPAGPVVPADPQGGDSRGDDRGRGDEERSRKSRDDVPARRDEDPSGAAGLAGAEPTPPAGGSGPSAPGFSGDGGAAGAPADGAVAGTGARGRRDRKRTRTAAGRTGDARARWRSARRDRTAPPRRRHRSLDAGARIDGEAAATAPAVRRHTPSGGDAGRRIARMSQAAVTTAERFSFPLGLTLLVVVFLALQGRIDGRDPKFRLAPIDSKHDLVTFA